MAWVEDAKHEDLVLSSESDQEMDAMVTDLRKEANRKAAVPVVVSHKIVLNKGGMDAMSLLNKANVSTREENLDKGLDKGNEFTSLDSFSDEHFIRVARDGRWCSNLWQARLLRRN
jgi:hypothetical protein